MANDNFHVLRAWFQLEDSNTFCFTGWFDHDNVDQQKIQVVLDQTILEPELIQFTDPAGQYLLRTLGTKADVEYLGKVSLSSDLSNYTSLQIQNVSADGNDRYDALIIPIQELLKMQQQVESCVDSVSFQDGNPIIHGWVMSAQPVMFQLLDNQGKEIPFQVKWSDRKDVFYSYRETNVSSHCGFTILVEDSNCDKVTLCLRSGTKKSEFPFGFTSLKRSLAFERSTCRRVLLRIKQFATGHYGRQAVQYIRTNGWKRFLRRTAQKLAGKPSDNNYGTWRLLHIPTPQQLECQKKQRFSLEPTFSIVVPLYKTPQNYLQKLIDSVKSQTYGKWELCLSDGSGSDSPLASFLDDVKAREQRIKVVTHDKKLQISENTNAAIEIATGEYIVFADHDDELTPDALYECLKAINEEPDIDLLYSDEDKVSMDGKEFFEPHFKPDYSIDLLRSMNYFCHLTVIKRSLLNHIGLLRSEFDGAQDYDLVLRGCEQAKNIHHIPKVLYHWRFHKGSTAENPESKLYAFDAGKRAVQAHYDRLGIPATVERGDMLGVYRTMYHWTETPLDSILIPNKDHINDLEQCVQSILKKSTYHNYEILVIENNSTEDETFRYYKKLEAQDSRIRILYYKGDFNYSKINNFGARQAKGDYYLLLNNDTEVINPHWLEEMLGYCMRSDVAIVGARLYYPDDTIQHAGVVAGLGGVAGHVFIGLPKGNPGYFRRIICAQDLSVVTAACMMVKKAAFWEVDGLTEELKVAFNDVDFCLKIRQQGYLIVYNPYVELYHYESKSRGYEDSPEKIARFQGEIDWMKSHWGDFFAKGDPYYNVNLTLDRQDYSLR